MKNRIFAMMALAAALCACSKEQDAIYEPQTPEVNPQESTVFTATMEGAPESAMEQDAPETKATFDDTYKCASWEIGDKISINGTVFQAKTAGTRTTFSVAEIRPTFYSGSPVTNTSKGVSPDMLVDEKGTDSKWCDHVIDGGIHIIVSTDRMCKLQSIKLWNGGDTQSQSGRRWKDVNVYGAYVPNPESWDLLKSFTNLNLAINNNGVAGELVLNSTKEYLFYKIVVLSAVSGTLQQMSDMKFVVTDSSPYDAYFPADLSKDRFRHLLPATQNYTPGKFDMPMYAHSTTNDLEFKNLCAVLAINVTSADVAQLKSIKVSSDKAMYGDFRVIDNKAVLNDPTDNSKAVVLNIPTAVILTTAGTTFYIAIPAQDYEYLNIYLSQDGVHYDEAMGTKAAAGLGSIERNKIYNIDYAKNAAKMWMDIYKPESPYFAIENPSDRRWEQDIDSWGANWEIASEEDLTNLLNKTSLGYLFSDTDDGYFKFIGRMHSVFLPATFDYDVDVHGTDAFCKSSTVDDTGQTQYLYLHKTKEDRISYFWTTGFTVPYTVCPVLRGSGKRQPIF